MITLSKETAEGKDPQYTMSFEENCRFFDEKLDPHTGQVREFLSESGSAYGTDVILLTDADIDALKSGKMLVIGQGEYATVICYGEIVPDE